MANPFDSIMVADAPMRTGLREMVSAATICSLGGLLKTKRSKVEARSLCVTMVLVAMPLAKGMLLCVTMVLIATPQARERMTVIKLDLMVPNVAKAWEEAAMFRT